MCIVLISTAHKKYPYILVSNRDEYLSRPTSPATWWPDHPQVLAGRDLQRSIRGTWLGITTSGRIAALTNFREQGVDTTGVVSRGEVIKDFLTATPDYGDESVDTAAHRILQRPLNSVGGFSLLLGRLRRPKEDGSRGAMVVVSNRSTDLEEIPRLADGADQTHGLSNALFGDDACWPKIGLGRRLLQEAVAEHQAHDEDRDELLDRLFKLLSTDTLPREESGSAWETQIARLRGSIFIPRLGYHDRHAKKPADELAAADSVRLVGAGVDMSGAYGTQKQTVILVDGSGHVTCVERTLCGEDGQALAADDEISDARFEFDIKGWDEGT